MNSNLPPYAIAFYRTKIDFFEKTTENRWSLRHRIETPSLEESAIAEAFSAHAREWLQISKDILCWFPRSLSEVFKYQKPQNEDVLEKKFLQKDKRASGKILVFSNTNFDQKSADNEYLVVNQEDYEDVIGFVENYGFKVQGIARAPLHSRNPSPPIFSIAKSEQLDQGTAKPPTQKMNTNLKNSTSAPSESREGLTALVASLLLPAVLIAILISLGVLVWQFAKPPASSDAALQDAGNAQQTQQGANPDGEQVLQAPEGILPYDSANIDQYEGIAVDTEGMDLIDNEGMDLIDDVDEAFVDPLSVDTPQTAQPTENGSGIFRMRPDDHAQRFAVLNADIIQTPMARDAAKIEANLKRIAALEANNRPAPVPADTNYDHGDGTYVANGPSSRVATIPDAIDLSDIALLGIYGPSGRPIAMIRTAAGNVSSVKSGESVDGWNVVAISRTEVIIRKGPDQKRLRVPN